MTTKNTRSDNLATVSFAPASTGDCLSDVFVQEFLRRLNISVPEQNTVGDAVVSASPPEDTDKIWYPADSNGFPQGVAYRFDSLKSQWVSTFVEPPPPPCLTEGEDNIISEDTDGCWGVSRQLIQQIIEEFIPSISSDPDNAIQLGDDGGWKVVLDKTTNEGRFEVLTTPEELVTNTAAEATTTFDLTTVVGLVIPTWATHAIIRSTVEMTAEELASNSTDKSYAQVVLNTQVVNTIGSNPGPNSATQISGTNTVQSYAELTASGFDYEFVHYQAPDWDGARDAVSFKIELIGFIRAGIPS